jgi:hypothetical protein
LDRYVCLKESDVIIPRDGEEESSSEDEDDDDDSNGSDDDEYEEQEETSADAEPCVEPEQQMEEKTAAEADGEDGEVRAFPSLFASLVHYWHP